MKKTDWFPHQIKPIRVGVYQIKNPITGEPVYAHWGGKYWGYYKGEFNDAIAYELDFDLLVDQPDQDKVWRGLAEKPE